MLHRRARSRSLLTRLLPACLLLVAACGAPDPVDVSSSALRPSVEQSAPPPSEPAANVPLAGGAAGTTCSSNADCATGLLCCYPCGIDGCDRVCMKPDPRTKRCPMFL